MRNHCIHGTFEGKPISCGLFQGEFFEIYYISSWNNEQRFYAPCEEDKEVLIPYYEDALMGKITDQEALVNIANIMRDWDYDI